MSVFRSIVFSAVAAGFVVGVAVTAAQLFSTVPLILKSEGYERAAEVATKSGAAGHEHSDHQHADHDHGAAAWEPKEGLQRNLFTAGANVLTAIGFALLLAGIYALRGDPGTWHEGLLWG